MKEKYIGRKIEMIYQDKRGEVTQRRIEVILVRGNSLLAYCLDKRGIRTFSLSQILAVMPMEKGKVG